MSSTPQSLGPRPFTGKHMLSIMAVFFGVIIVVNFSMAFLASSSWTGLVVKNTYVASQKYNAHLVAAKVQQKYGYFSDLSYENGNLIFVLNDQDGNQLKVMDLKVRLGRPAFEQQDQVLFFEPNENLSNRLQVELQPGIWALSITGKVGTLPYRRDARLFVNIQDIGTVE